MSVLSCFRTVWQYKHNTLTKYEYDWFYLGLNETWFHFLSFSVSIRINIVYTGDSDREVVFIESISKNQKPRTNNRNIN